MGYVLRYKMNDKYPPNGEEVSRLMCLSKEYCIEGEVYRVPAGVRQFSEFMSKPKCLYLHRIIPRDHLGFGLNTVYGFVDNIFNEIKPSTSQNPVYVPRIDKIDVN
jgi:hypothetical protein